jgi:signal transduction histidine kinase
MPVVTWLDQNIIIVLGYFLAILVVAILAEFSIRRVQKESFARLKAEKKSENHEKELIKTKKKLLEEGNQLSAVLSSMGEGLMVCDNKKRVLMLNQTGGTMLRISPKEMIGKRIENESLFICKRKNKKVKFSDIVDKVINKSEIVSIEPTDHFNCIPVSGKNFSVSMVIAPLSKNGKNIGAITLFRDSTREEKIDEMKTDFVSVASHQLRTPLTAINYYLEMLLANDVGKISKEQKKFITEVYGVSKHAVELVNDLLNVSRMETGRLKIVPAPTDLVIFLRDTVRSASVLVDKNKCKIIFNKPKEKLSMIPLDQVLLRQVIRNFITNAIRYSATKGQCKVVVKLKESKQGYEISVRDEGIGIPVEVQHRVFEKFFRADNAKLVATEGTGLGLHVAKSIMDQSGGKIWFDSIPNKGSTFYLLVPLGGMKNKKGDTTLSVGVS